VIDLFLMSQINDPITCSPAANASFYKMDCLRKLNIFYCVLNQLISGCVGGACDMKYLEWNELDSDRSSCFCSDCSTRICCIVSVTKSM